MEPEKNKIISPISGRKIIIGGQAYNNLLESDYTNHYLLSLNIIYKNQSFWKDKFINDYGLPHVTNVDWKKILL